MSEVNHSPTPWATETGVHGIICDYNGMIIVDTAGCSYNDLENVNASYIVSCVNSHDALTAENARLEAENAKMREALMKIENSAYGNAGCLRSPCPHFDDEVTCEHCEYCSTTIARDALAAEGGAK